MYIYIRYIRAALLKNVQKKKGKKMNMSAVRYRILIEEKRNRNSLTGNVEKDNKQR